MRELQHFMVYIALIRHQTVTNASRITVTQGNYPYSMREKEL